MLMSATRVKAVGLPSHLHNKVNAANLVHELHAVREQDALSGLDLVLLEDMQPALLGLALEREGMQDLSLFLLDGRVIGLLVKDVAEHLDGIVMSAFVEQITRRVRKSENENDDDDGEDDLASDGQSPRDFSADEVDSIVEPVC